LWLLLKPLAQGRKQVEQEQGATFPTWFGWPSLLVFAGMSVILILQRLVGITPFGATPYATLSDTYRVTLPHF